MDEEGNKMEAGKEHMQTAVRLRAQGTGRLSIQKTKQQKTKQKQTVLREGPLERPSYFNFCIFLSFLLVLTSLSHADSPFFASTPQTCWDTTISLSSDFDLLIKLALAIGVALGALALMAGQALQRPETAFWAKNELVTLGWSVLLIVFVVGGFFFSCQLSQLMAGSGSPQQAAIQYLDQLQNRFGLSLARDLVQSSIGNQMEATAFAYWTTPIDNGGGVAFRANKRAWAQQKDLLNDIYLPLLMLLNIQKLGFELIIPAVAGVLLPAALMLRLFFFSRDIGNFLIALCFSLYFALPLVYVLSMQAVNQIIADACQKSGAACTPDTPLPVSSLGSDAVLGDNLQRVGFLAPQAILIPNLALVVVATMTMALNKALKGFVP